MKWNQALPVLFGLVVMGCTDVKPQGVFRPSNYQHYEDAVYVDFYWNCSRPDPRTLVIQGVAAYKPSGSTIFYPTFILEGLDPAGKVVSKAAGRARVPIIGLNDSVPWEVVLPLHGGEVAFNLEYVYLWRDYGGKKRKKKVVRFPNAALSQQR